MPSLSTDSPKSPDSKDSVTAKKTISGFEELVTLRCLAFEQDQYTRDDAKHGQAGGDR